MLSSLRKAHRGGGSGRTRTRAATGRRSPTLLAHTCTRTPEVMATAPSVATCRRLAQGDGPFHRIEVDPLAGLNPTTVPTDTYDVARRWAKADNTTIKMTIRNAMTAPRALRSSESRTEIRSDVGGHWSHRSDVSRCVAPGSSGVPEAGTPESGGRARKNISRHRDGISRPPGQRCEDGRDAITVAGDSSCLLHSSISEV